MSGRFFAAPLLIGTILLSRLKVQPNFQKYLIVGAILIIGVSLVTSTNQVFTDASYFSTKPWDHGIADERGVYFPTTGFVNKFRKSTTPYIPREASALRFQEAGAVGKIGYNVGHYVHIIDFYALGDPLLARIPIEFKYKWRIGHFARPIPDGYQETLESGINQIANQNIARYYNALTKIIRGDLWSWDRLVTIISMNWGFYDDLVTFDQIYPIISIPKEIPYSIIQEPRLEGTRWDAEGVFKLQNKEIHILLDSIHHDLYFETTLDHNNLYKLLFQLEEKTNGEITIQSIKKRGLVCEKRKVPLSSVQAGFDTVVVLPIDEKDPLSSIGHFVLMNE